ncbi:MAG: ABC transporter permease subunit [Anaerolineae bacterium]|nr:ABC transporter permease subunit [Anaerolineae bacterium]
MATAAKSTPNLQQGDRQNAESLPTRLLKYFGLMILNAFALLLVYSFFYDGNPGLSLVVGLITLFVNVVIFVPSLSPIRWMAPGLALAILLVIYPITFTVQTAFTNYSNVDHPYPKEQAAQQIARVGGFYVGENNPIYNWENENTFVNAEGVYALWITREVEGVTEGLFVAVGQAAVSVENPTEVPAEFQGFRRMERREVGRALRDLQSASFGAGEETYSILRGGQVAVAVPRYVFNAENGTLLDQSTGNLYVGDDSVGFFVREGGNAENPNDILRPGYRVFVGLYNFTRLLNEPALSGPLVNIFIWTVVFAFASVFTTFALGLLMALILNDSIIPGRKIIRSLLLIPYAIPGVISILIWRGMMNLNLGIINDFIGVEIPWLNDPFWSKVAIIVVNLWLGYPYMMLICSGALQAIPSEVYEAAAVDGANPWQRFWNITLPLLLVAVGPLLIGSFTFNFNNYLLITALTGGNPPISGSPIAGAGQTDILISYVYKAAFSNQADYGYASAITIVIFLIVASVTLLQYRFTRTLEQVSENV